MAIDTDDEDGIDRSVPSGESGARSTTVFEQLRSSFSLQLAAAGLTFIAIGFVLNTGVWAGMLPIWGIALLAIGVGSYAYTAVSRRGSQE